MSKMRDEIIRRAEAEALVNYCYQTRPWALGCPSEAGSAEADIPQPRLYEDVYVFVPAGPSVGGIFLQAAPDSELATLRAAKNCKCPLEFYGTITTLRRHTLLMEHLDFTK